ncbi:carboxypeptidase Y-deficient [Polyrhizophydium stewartii]|uniref:Carboxypeptidase Y-deficient n=1 Tax=Polyrhizophydium stewartii TaxID=2732419 RepID=A0ABR4MXC3_9FUNG
MRSGRPLSAAAALPAAPAAASAAPRNGTARDKGKLPARPDDASSLASSPGSRRPLSIASASSASTQHQHPSPPTQSQPPFGQSPTSDLFICPICGQPTATLGQLNRHIDLNHPEDTRDPTDMLLSWFRKTQTKVKSNWQKLGIDRLADGIKGSAQAPLDLIKGLEPFELNPNSALESPGSPSMDGVGGGRLSFADANASAASLGEQAVSRAHWQRESPDDRCAIAGCGRALGIIAGSHNCRKCGRRVCEIHSRFQMRLAANAQHDPVDGVWCRVCEACYTGRAGYADTLGVSRNKTQGFLRLRAARVDVTLIEANKIEKRVEKLTKALSGESSPAAVHRRSLSALNPLSRTLAAEQSVVAWVPDDSSNECFVCSKQFGIRNRRHHCRLCGRLICGSCSSMLELKRQLPDGTTDKVGEVRMCSECKSLISLRKSRDMDMPAPPIVSIHQHIVRLRIGALETLPKFNALLVDLRQRRTISLTDQDYQVALKLRKTLLDVFTEIERLGKQIKQLPTSNASTRRLQDNMHLAAVQFLQANMLTLQLMPSSRTEADAAASEAAANGAGSGAQSGLAGLKAAQLSFASPEDEEKYRALEAEVAVLEEQMAQLEGLLIDATTRRRLEDARAIDENLGELRSAVNDKRDLMAQISSAGKAAAARR